MNKPTQDKSREWLTLWKLRHLINIFTKKELTKILLSCDKFADIDFGKLKCAGRIWIILDVDECIAPHHWNILPENIEILKKLVRNWFKIVIFSNMKKTQRYNEIEQLWITIITSQFAKPNPKWFEECLKELWLQKSEVVMIWDNFITDWWCNYAGIPFIKIKPIESNSKLSTKRLFQILFRKAVDSIAKKYHKKS